MTVTLRTGRFILRQPQLGDAEAIARYLNDFEVAGNLARVPFPYHLSDARAWLRTRRPLFRLIVWKRIFSLSVVAGVSVTGQLTSDSLR